MLPTPLVSIYQQYKQDTDSVASWLASTAKACGYPSNLLASPDGNAPQKAAGRLKGKARSEAKKNGRLNTARESKPNVRRYTVAIKDFISLAEFIGRRRS